MSEPIVEQIAENLVETLRSIRLSNGYHQDVTVERRLLAGNHVRDNLIVVFQNDPPKQDEAPVQRIEWMQPFMCLCYCIESEKSSVAIDKRLNRIRSDVEKAVMANPSRGGIAIDTIIRQPLYFTDTDASAEGIIVQVDVQYRVLETDPYTRA